MNKTKTWDWKWVIILFSFITVVIGAIIKNHSEWIEKYYSNTINKWTRQFLSKLTGLFSFSIAEFLVIFLVFVLIGLIIMLLFHLNQRKFSKYFLNILAYFSMLHMLFMFLWGFNYDRVSFDQIAGLSVKEHSIQQLYELCEKLIKRTNEIREEVQEDSEGVMVVSGGYKSVLERSTVGFENISQTIPELGGKYGPPKPILLSEMMNYTGITGIYIPYTAEANVNISIPEAMLPCTVLHEMAHQRGFAREDEANYIAYVVSIHHPDVDFQYSGTLLALIYSMNALAQYDIESYHRLKTTYADGVRRDLQYQIDFWEKYRGRIEKISREVNNAYLKSNGQQEGILSYGKMVDYLLAEYNK